MLPALLALLALPHVLASPEEDAARLGAYYTNIAIYRTGSGNNIVTVGLGDPEQTLNLTLSTNVDFILAVSDECDDCVQDAERFTPGDSRTITPSQRALSASAIYPTSDGSIDAILLDGSLVTERLSDPRQDSYDRVIGVVSQVEEMTQVGESGRSGTLPEGVSGFFGLGVYQESKQWSLMPSLMQVNGRGAPAGVTSYVVGFDMAPFSRDLGVQAGNMHFGGVPVGAYTGNFNWMDANATVAGSWGVKVDRMRVADNVIGTERYYGSLDPGFDSIYVPEALAEDIFSRVPNAQRDGTDTGRWNVPCDADISMTVTIAGREYKVDSSQLVQQRGVSPNSCWSSIVAWQSGGLPDTRGEIRLGTPFLTGVYAAIYYSDKQQLVGLAGKPGTVNDANLYSKDRGGANGKLAGILIGSLLAGLIVLLLLCYGRNRNSFQSTWYRAIRRQHRAQVNALVRAATIPPPVIGGPLVVPPPMMGMGMGGPMMGGMGGMGGMGPMGGGGMGPMGPMGPSYIPVPQGPGHMGHGGMGMGMGMAMGGQAPPMYQQPMQPQQQPHHHHQHPQQQQYGQAPLPYNARPPPSIEHTPKGIYSSRHHSLPAKASHAFVRSPKPPRYSQPSGQMGLPAQTDQGRGQAMSQIPNAGPPPTQNHHRRESSTNKHNSQKVQFRGPDNALAGGSPGLAQGWDQSPYPGPVPGQSGGSRGQSSRKHKYKIHYGPENGEEPSMVQRDRIKVEEERAMLDTGGKVREYGPTEQHANVTRIGTGTGTGKQRLHQPQHSPTQSEKKRWWRNSRNLGMDQQYAPVQTQTQFAGTPPHGGNGHPHNGGTGEVKSFFSDRGWNKWSRHEKEQDRRASRLGGGQVGGQWYV